MPRPNEAVQAGVAVRPSRPGGRRSPFGNVPFNGAVRELLNARSSFNAVGSIVLGRLAFGLFEPITKFWWTSIAITMHKPGTFPRLTNAVAMKDISVWFTPDSSPGAVFTVHPRSGGD